MKPSPLLSLAWFQLLLACGASSQFASSALMTSTDARHALGPAREFPPSLAETAEDPRLLSDWLFQRKSLWNFWSYLFAPSREGQGPLIANWQSWYSSADLSRLFKRLYSGLSKSERQARRPFTPDEIAAAFDWHDRLQFEDPSWDKKRYEEWLGTFKDEPMQRSIPGFNKILMNREAVWTILSGYEAVFRCLRQSEARELCPPLLWPRGSAFLKTAWRRSGDGFHISSFPTSGEAFAAQISADRWTPDASWEPGAGESYAMQTKTFQNFHLTGMHLALRASRQWIWSSIWLGPTASEDFASDHPQHLDHYRLCTAISFASPLEAESSAEALWPEALRTIARTLRGAHLSNWCSNPYLELGSNNQKTNCIGCHQYAGLNWSRDALTARLAADLSALREPAEQGGPSDAVWSLLNGPDALALVIADTIDYFDAYDPF